MLPTVLHRNRDACLMAWDIREAYGPTRSEDAFSSMHYANTDAAPTCVAH
jgi:hypothetical protein